MNFLNLATVFAATAGKGIKLPFNPQGFIDMLPYMGIGMLVIFVLIGIFVLVSMLINKLFSGK